MAATQIKDGFNGGSDNQLKVNSDGSINTTGGSSGCNASVGATGSIAPTSATEVAGVNTTGVLTPVSVTDSGAINVNIGGFDTLSPGSPGQIPVTTNSTQLLAANPNRKYAHIMNNGASEIFIQYQISAVLNQGIRIRPGSFYTLESNNLWLGSINAIGVMSSQLIDVLEGE